VGGLREIEMNKLFSARTVALLLASASASFAIVIASFWLLEPRETTQNFQALSAGSDSLAALKRDAGLDQPTARSVRADRRGDDVQAGPPPLLVSANSESNVGMQPPGAAIPQGPQLADLPHNPVSAQVAQGPDVTYGGNRAPAGQLTQAANPVQNQDTRQIDVAALEKKCSTYDAGKVHECVEACPYDADPVHDDDFARNCADIVKNHLKYEAVPEFEEGGRTWHIQVLRNPKKPQGPLWFLPHDNENVAFDSAIHGLINYGGVLVAIETGGQRENQGQDPNRNFDAGAGPLCPLQRARSPIYTQQIIGRWNGVDPIIALHSNTPGGSISVKRATGLTEPYPGAKSEAVQPRLRSLFAPDDTLVFMASPLAGSLRVEGFKNALTAQGVNVLWEHVDTTHNDCSLSNYAALKKIENYFNVEVAHSSRRGSTSEKAQKSIIDLIMALNGNRNASGAQTGSLQSPSAGRRNVQ
jgi:hypothetical protein